MYHGQASINSYFSRVFGIELQGKTTDAILAEGLAAIFSVYEQFGVAKSFAELLLEPLNEKLLDQTISKVAQNEWALDGLSAAELKGILLGAV